jgi:hypothetical protein
MSKVKLLHEDSEGTWKLITRALKRDSCKPDKETEVKFNKKEKAGEKARLFQEPSLWRKALGIGPFRYMPLFQTSYSSDMPLDWSGTTKVALDPKMYKKMREEDVVGELLRPDMDRKTLLYGIGIGALIGAMAAYILMTADFAALGVF